MADNSDNEDFQADSLNIDDPKADDPKAADLKAGDLDGKVGHLKDIKADDPKADDLEADNDKVGHLKADLFVLFKLILLTSVPVYSCLQHNCSP